MEKEVFVNGMEDSNCQVIDPNTFGNNEIALIENMIDVVNIVNNTVVTIADTIKYTQDIKLQIKQLDVQLECFIEQTRSNLERFKSAMPVLEKQLNNISARIDRITDSIIANTESNNMTEDMLKKHQLLLDLLGNTNDSFNNMLVRILSL